MRRVTEDDSAQAIGGGEKGQYRQLGIERAGRADGVVARADPIDRVIGEQQPAVGPNRALFAHAEREAAACFAAPVGLLYGADDPVDHALYKRRLGPIAVNAHRAGSGVRMRGIDQQVVGRNVALPLDSGGRSLHHRVGDEEHVAGHERELARGRFLDHDGDSAQLPLLPDDFSTADAAGDRHFIRSGEFGGAGADLEVGFDRANLLRGAGKNGRAQISK